MLRVQLTRLSPTHHRFKFIREDGTEEACQLETRSFLTHDLVHLAVEIEAGLEHSFFGKLAAGRSLHDATDGMKLKGEILATERVVGVMTGIVQGKATPAAGFEGLAALFAADGDPLPQWLTLAFLEHVAERFRRLMGQWKATPFGETMETVFVPASSARPR